MNDDDYQDETLPCGHRVPTFLARSGRMVPIAIPAQRNDEIFLNLPPKVWCIENDRPSCGWVSVTPDQFERVTANGYA